MAVVSMKKLRLIGFKTDEKRILSALHRTNRVQTVDAPKEDYSVRESDPKVREELESKLSRLLLAVNFVEEQKRELVVRTKKDEEPYKPKSGGLFKVRKEVSYDDFSSVNAREIELFAQVYEIEEMMKKLSETNSELVRTKNLAEQLTVYFDLPLPFSSYKDTRLCSVFLGTCPASEALNIEHLLSYEYAHTEVISKHSGEIVLFSVCLNEFAQEFSLKLSELSFSKCPFDYDQTAASKIEELKQKLVTLAEDKKNITVRAAEENVELSELKLLYDSYLVEKEMTDAGEGFDRTDKTFYMEAWIPKTEESEINNVLMSINTHIMFEFAEPKEGEVPPTLMKNGWFVSAFESVTNMYSPPVYSEKDPTASLSIFFFIFFGIMLSDAAYGLILVIASLLLLRFVKMEAGMRKMVKVIFWGGIATTFWGALFGGWFGIESEAIPRLFNPMMNPIPVFILCLGLGVLQVMMGFAMKGIQLISEKKYLDALCDSGSWLVLFTGFILVVLTMVVESLKAFSTVGFVVVLLGVLMLLLTQGRAKKNIFGKIIGGFGGLYGIINILSDILSYSRLFALCLATGVIAMVMNILGTLCLGMPYFLGVIPAIAIYLVGHIFNIAINVLGAYVHDCRLQYVEYFSKFYTGGGLHFSPLGSNLKFNIIK